MTHHSNDRSILPACAITRVRGVVRSTKSKTFPPKIPISSTNMQSTVVSCWSLSIRTLTFLKARESCLTLTLVTIRPSGTRIMIMMTVQAGWSTDTSRLHLHINWGRWSRSFIEPVAVIPTPHMETVTGGGAASNLQQYAHAHMMDRNFFEKSLIMPGTEATPALATNLKRPKQCILRNRNRNKEEWTTMTAAIVNFLCSLL